MSKNTKPSFVEGIYSTSVSFDITEIEQELGICWDDVTDFYIKWCCLFLTMKDGTVLEVNKEPGEMDWKRPYETNLLDDGFEVL